MKTIKQLSEIPITDSNTYLKIEKNILVFNYEKYSDYLIDQCQKRDELIKAQDELIKELCEEEGAVLYIKKLEEKVEQLKKELQ